MAAVSAEEQRRGRRSRLEPSTWCPPSPRLKGGGGRVSGETTMRGARDHKSSLFLQDPEHGSDSFCFKESLVYCLICHCYCQAS